MELAKLQKENEELRKEIQELSERELPLDLFVDMTITMDKLKDKFNCNDGQLDDIDLDWIYFHKLARRSKFHCEKIGVIFNE